MQPADESVTFLNVSKEPSLLESVITPVDTRRVAGVLRISSSGAKLRLCQQQGWRPKLL